jgi:hypothetical protein
MSANVWSVYVDAEGEGTWASEADFSTAGVAAVRARRRRLKPCSSMRYEAIDDFPAQIPGSCQMCSDIMRAFVSQKKSRTCSSPRK